MAAAIGIDTAKARNAVVVAEGGRNGEVRYLGKFDNTSDGVAKLIRKLASRYETLLVCYEAGPTGYGLYRNHIAPRRLKKLVGPNASPPEIPRFEVSLFFRRGDGR